ncbi:hypothetical protein AVEN_269555-1 [Araneus ventricosus]|uniref:DUF4817 domain-containing protein n=1 Tax=Araneus ventricosus TaxID=182803 RepID=A0A4Y2CF42_ARAVE|nr:hypothetical protein AVEN_269555-1 [Araneus ventricosus]
MLSDDIVNVMYRENFPRFSQSACVQRFFNSEKAMQGNKIRRQIAFAELRSATYSVRSRRKKLLDDHVNVWCGIFNDRLIGPVFYEGTLTGQGYLELQQDVITDLVEYLPLHQLRKV